MKELIEYPDGSIYFRVKKDEGNKTIFLTYDEASLYKLRADEGADLWHNRETISEREEEELLKIFNKYNIHERHHNYLRWVTGSLVYMNLIIESKEAAEIRRFISQCKKMVTSDPVTRITLNINSHEAHLTSYQSAMEDIMEVLKPVLSKYAETKSPGKLNRKRGNRAPLMVSSLNNIAYNLVTIIGIPIHKAKDILFRIGALAGYWESQKPAGSKYKTDTDYRRTKVNKYFQKRKKLDTKT